MDILLQSYSEKTVSQVCGAFGICTKNKFFPTISELKQALDEVATTPATEEARQARIREQFETRKMFFEKGKQRLPGDYTGPIEDVKPGDILTPERQIEYRAYMAKKHQMNNVKLWGPNEEYKDSGARPFAVKLPDQPLPKQPEEPNPFE